MSVGNFATFGEANACLKYLKTKFARTMLGIRKVTQESSKRVWEFVPNQDFTSNSDINWSLSIPEIDQQLYRKYKLQDYIEFIEETVKPME